MKRFRFDVPAVAALMLFAVLCVGASQAVTAFVLLRAPPPAPPGLSIDEAVAALKGEAAETADGRRIRTRIDAQPVAESDEAPLAPLLRQLIARRLERSASDVRVRIDGPTQGALMPMASRETFVLRQRDTPRLAPVAPESLPAPAPHEAPPAGSRIFAWRAETTGPGGDSVLRLDRLTFPPFAVSVREPDGRWRTAEAAEGWLTPWRLRVLAAFAATLVLLTPLVWWLSRRFTRPIRAFAEAAERMTRDPDAEPTPPAGPREVRAAMQAFNDSQSAIRRHLSERARTLAAVAHDLRTPMTRLRFRVEQIPAGLRGRMIADVEEMDQLIAQALAFARGDRADARPVAVDLAAVARDCAAGFAEIGQPIVWRDSPALPVRADPGAIRRALANLMDNAVRYGGGGEVEGRLDGRWAVVAVTDRGPGLSDDDREAMFEPFVRGERSRNRDTGGAGLGLSAARQAARASGGDVVLAATPGGGLTAELRLPLA